MASRLIAITGGIGSGKSVVSRILKVMGYAVYDTDTQARRLMNQSADVKARLVTCFGPEIYHNYNGLLNAHRLSQIVFGNNEALSCLNGIVHPAVRCDLRQWAGRCQSRYAFVETALLYESRLCDIVDIIWKVTAPLTTRVQRVMARNGLTEAEVLARIEAQAAEDRVNEKTHIIVNDGIEALLPQVMRLLK